MDDYTFDLQRILVGDLPGMFYVEIAMRTAVMFLFALGMIRLMGKRSLGQLSAFDFVIIIALGSAVGDPMFYDDVPLLYGMVVVVIVVALERALAWVTTRSTRIEAFLDSQPTILVRHGEVDAGALSRQLMTHNELHQALRSADVESLDDVELAILEPSGQLSILRRDATHVDPEVWSIRGGLNQTPTPNPNPS